MKERLSKDLQIDITKFQNDIKKLEEDLSASSIKEETYKSSLDRFKSFSLKISKYNKLYEVRNKIKLLLIRPFEKSNKIGLWFTIVFGLFGIAGMIIGYIGLSEQRTSSELIHEKNQIIINQSSRINELQKQFIQEFRGGDSYCYVSPIPFKNGLLLQVFNGGEYTVYDVYVTISDIEYTHRLRPNDFVDLNKTIRNFNVGNIGKKSTHQIGLLSIDEKSNQQRYSLSISARNGWIGQKIILRKCYNEKRKSFRWCIAYRVTRDNSILKEYIDEKFPRSDGEAIWDW